MDASFWSLWVVGVLVAAIVLRIAYARNRRIANIAFWVLLAIFLTPVGAILVYLLMSVLRNNRPPALPHADTER